MGLGSPVQPIYPKQNAARRKRLLINPHFQTVFALYAITTTLLMVPIFMAANYYFFNLFASKARSLGLPPEHELLRFVDRQQTLMVVVFIFATSVAMLSSVIISYFFSNRIAGSMYRLTTAMNQTMDAATANKINPRRFDFFKEMYEAYNQLVDRLRAP